MSKGIRWIIICALGIAATVLLFVDADVSSAWGIWKIILGLAAVGLWIAAIVLGAGGAGRTGRRPPRVR